jgi:hypothetical protein
MHAMCLLTALIFAGMSATFQPSQNKLQLSYTANGDPV